MKKICFLTGTRAEYGLLRSLILSCNRDPSFKTQIIATGTHLRPEYGNTYLEIEKDGLFIDKKVEILSTSTTIKATAEAIARAVTGLTKALQELTPDLLILLGDRYEAMACAIAATLGQIPIAHIHGGEITEGAIDDVFRHSISKMSHLHFTSIPEYQKRVIQLGENPERVFCVGGLGVDAIEKRDFYSRKELEKNLMFDFGEINFLVTVHPETIGKTLGIDTMIENLLNALSKFDEAKYIFTGANADPEGMIINHKFNEYAKNHPEKALFISSLGQRRFFSILKIVDGIIGNSSSGLLEAPSFKVGTLNLGNRQKGRVRCESVIDCPWDEESIYQGLSEILEPSFKERLVSIVNPYARGDSTLRIKNVLKDIDFQSLLEKKFYDFCLS